MGWIKAPVVDNKAGKIERRRIKLQVVGRMRSGKDSVHEIISRHYPEVKRIANADLLKSVSEQTMWVVYDCMEAAGIAPDREEFRRMVETKDFNRIFLIDFGTGIMRKQVLDSIWYDGTCNKNADILQKGEFVITDTRFENEYDCYEGVYGVDTLVISVDDEILWQRYKRDFPEGTRRKYEEFKNGSTEQLADKLIRQHSWNIDVIENNGTYEEFERKVLEFVERKYYGRQT